MHNSTSAIFLTFCFDISTWMRLRKLVLSLGCRAIVKLSICCCDTKSDSISRSFSRRIFKKWTDYKTTLQISFRNKWGYQTEKFNTIKIDYMLPPSERSFKSAPHSWDRLNIIYENSYKYFLETNLIFFHLNLRMLHYWAHNLKVWQQTNRQHSKITKVRMRPPVQHDRVYVTSGRHLANTEDRGLANCFETLSEPQRALWRNE